MQKSKEGGITLIALIITIIVMLILVGVTVNVALNGGLFENANKAAKDTQYAADRESLQTALIASYNLADGDIDIDELKRNLGDDWTIDGNGPYTITSPNGNVYIVETDGTIRNNKEEQKPQVADQKYFTYTFDEDNKTATITGVAEKYQEKWMYGDYSAITCIKDGDSYIKDVVLPSTVTNNGETYTVTKIGNEAFANYHRQWADENEIQNGFTSFVIPDTVIEIGEHAFDYQRKLTNITIPNSVTSIGNSAFAHCSSLTSVTIPDSVTSIGDYTFYNCSNLTNITIPDSVTSIGYCAFLSCSRLTNITIPESVTSIEERAFSGCSRLTNITIPDSVTSIEKGVFSGCSSLTNITIPNSVTSIGNYAFANCSSLKNITIPDSVTSIGDEAFFNCSSLKNITIPDSVTTMGDSVFSACSSDLQIKCRASIKPSGWNDYWARKILNGTEYYTPTWGYTGE